MLTATLNKQHRKRRKWSEVVSEELENGGSSSRSNGVFSFSKISGSIPGDLELKGCLKESEHEGPEEDIIMLCSYLILC
jgi:hypothetical protein